MTADNMNLPSLKKNYAFNIAYQVLNLAIPLVSMPYVSRVLGADGIGIYSYTSSISAYFTMFAALGTASYGMREIAQHRDSREECTRLFWEIELLVVITTMIALLLWLIPITISEKYTLCFIALTPAIASTMLDITWFFLGKEQMGFVVVRNTVIKIAGLVLLFLLVKSENDVITYLLIYSCTLFLGNIIMWPRLFSMIDKPTIRIKSLRNHFKETLVYFVPSIASSLYTVLDKALLGYIVSDMYQSGCYEQAEKIVRMAKVLVFSSLNLVMGARLSYLFSKKAVDEIKKRIEQSIDFILLCAYGFTFGIIGIAKTLVPLFFGPGFDLVVPLLYCMAPLIVIVGISNCLGSHYYTPSGQRARSAKYIVAGSVINLSLNILLIPFYGSFGAVVGSLLAESVITALYISHCNNYLTVAMVARCSWKRIFAGTIMFIGVKLLGLYLPFSLFEVVVLQLVTGVALYWIMLAILKDSMLNKIVTIFFSSIRRLTGEKNE